MVLSLLANRVQVDFFNSMDLPYHAISDSEADELADELTAVLRSVAGTTKASDITNARRAAAAVKGRSDADMTDSVDM